MAPVRSLIDRAAENSAATQSLITRSSGVCSPSHPASAAFPPHWSKRRPAAMYPNKALIAFIVPHPANEVARPLPLHRHLVGDRLQGGRVDTFAPNIDRGQLCHRLAAARNANRLAGGGLRDQFAQMRFGFGEVDLLHDLS